MKVVFSMSGEGFGHAARAVALAEHLKEVYDLELWGPETVQPFLREAFSDIPTRVIPILKLVKTAHHVHVFQTGLANFKLLFLSQKLVRELAEELKAKKVQAVVTDYEPLAAKAAKLAGIPVLAFNHQGVIEHKLYDGVDHVFAKIANCTMIPHYDQMIVTSFYNGDVGPIVRNAVVKATPQQGDYIFVYLKESFKPQLMPLLKEFPDHVFQFYPNKEADFVEGLAGAKAVIAPAGHQLICECLILKKPMLVFPESMQYEQRLNAEMLERLGWGMNASSGCLKEKLDTFLNQLDSFPRAADPTIRFKGQPCTDQGVKAIQEALSQLTSA